MTQPRHLPPEALNDWLDAVAHEFALDPNAISIVTLLNVAKDVAHSVARPAAPLSTFLMGIALGRATAAGTEGSAEARDQMEALADRLTQLAAEWQPA